MNTSLAQITIFYQNYILCWLQNNRSLALFGLLQVHNISKKITIDIFIVLHLRAHQANFQPNSEFIPTLSGFNLLMMVVFPLLSNPRQTMLASFFFIPKNVDNLSRNPIFDEKRLPRTNRSAR